MGQTISVNSKGDTVVTAPKSYIRNMVGLIKKQENIISAGEIVISSQDRQIKNLEDIRVLYKEQILIKEDNERLTALAITDLNKQLDKLYKQNKRLKSNIKIWKGVSIGLPILAVGTAGYFIFK